jgi:hypothetical protein
VPKRYLHASYTFISCCLSWRTKALAVIVANLILARCDPSMRNSQPEHAASSITMLSVKRAVLNVVSAILPKLGKGVAQLEIELGERCVGSTDPFGWQRPCDSLQPHRTLRTASASVFAIAVANALMPGSGKILVVLSILFSLPVLLNVHVKSTQPLHATWKASTSTLLSSLLVSLLFVIASRLTHAPLPSQASTRQSNPTAALRLLSANAGLTEPVFGLEIEMEKAAKLNPVGLNLRTLSPYRESLSAGAASSNLDDVQMSGDDSSPELPEDRVPALAHPLPMYSFVSTATTADTVDAADGERGTSLHDQVTATLNEVPLKMPCDSECERLERMGQERYQRYVKEDGKVNGGNGTGSMIIHESGNSSRNTTDSDSGDIVPHDVVSPLVWNSPSEKARDDVENELPNRANEGQRAAVAGAIADSARPEENVMVDVDSGGGGDEHSE